MWSEENVTSLDLQSRLGLSEVIHIAKCPHVGGEHHSEPLCVEPTHLMLGTIHERMREGRIRQEAL